jgi:hypothetical protein
MQTYTYAIGNHVVLLEDDAITVCDEQGQVDYLTAEEHTMRVTQKIGLINVRIKAVEAHLAA